MHKDLRNKRRLLELWAVLLYNIINNNNNNKILLGFLMIFFLYLSYFTLHFVPCCLLSMRRLKIWLTYPGDRFVAFLWCKKQFQLCRHGYQFKDKNTFTIPSNTALTVKPKLIFHPSWHMNHRPGPPDKPVHFAPM